MLSQQHKADPRQLHNNNNRMYQQPQNPQSMLALSNRQQCADLAHGAHDGGCGAAVRAPRQWQQEARGP
jgi:hypothetical protein